MLAATINKRPFTWLFALLATTVSLASCNSEQAPTQISEAPEKLTQPAANRTEARDGRIGLRARISYTDVQTLIESSLPATYPVQDSKRVCKKIFGLKACGTANWNLDVNRNGEISVSGQNDLIVVKAPISFVGVVGVDGGVAKALGLSKLDVSGAVVADITLGLDIDSSWCPSIDVSVDYNWTEAPTAVWRGSIDFSLESIVNDALDKQLSNLAPRINNSIDCATFKDQLQTQWRGHTFAFDLPVTGLSEEASKMHLNFTPSGFSFSGLNTHEDKLGLGFAIDGAAVFEPEALIPATLILPPLEKIEYEKSNSEFDILFRATYAQLEQLILPAIQGNTYSADSIAGKASVTISSLALSGSTDSITVSIGFAAQLPGKRNETLGTLFLRTRPFVDTTSETISLREVQITKILDSAVWDLIGSIFETQIISAIERNAVISYSNKLRDLENKITLQLGDSNRTAGLLVNPSRVSISVIEIIPELSSLAVLARVNAELDIDVPLRLFSVPIHNNSSSENTGG